MKYFEVIFNVNQTFVNFPPRRSRLHQGKGQITLVEKIKADAKVGFNWMITCEVLFSIIYPQFNVLNGTKLKYATNKKQTLVYKIWYRNKREDCTGHIVCQKWHWFDADINTECIELPIDEVCPNNNIGLLMDISTDQHGGIVGDYIKKWTVKGHLVVVFIGGGLTSILQVCDLASNKNIKALIKDLYLKWCRE